MQEGDFVSLCNLADKSGDKRSSVSAATVVRVPADSANLGVSWQPETRSRHGHQVPVLTNAEIADHFKSAPAERARFGQLHQRKQFINVRAAQIF
jgi:hypothetical protein